MIRKSGSAFPWVTTMIIIIYAIVFRWQQQAMQMGLSEYIVRDYAFQWHSFVVNPLHQIPKLFSNTFIHADIAHVMSNAIFFFVFAFFVERFIGSIEFLFLYFSGGAFAALIQGLFDPFTAGLVGASGAIAAVGGAFFVLAPSFLTFKKHLLFSALLLVWYGLEWYQQLRFPNVIPSLSHSIAHGAHVGGFVWGALWGGFHLIFTVD